MRWSRTLVVLILVGFLPLGRAAVADTATLRRDAASAIAHLLAERAARGSVAGVIVARDGVGLASRNYTRALLPASLMKLTTTTTAMIKFGPDATFATRVAGAAPDPQGVVHGNLYLIGGGDPTFATRAYRTRNLTRRMGMSDGQVIFPSGSPTVEDLGDKIKAAGITKIEGSVIADESLFDTRRTNPGWLSSYLFNSPDVSYLTALPTNEGFTTITKTTISLKPALLSGLFLKQVLGYRHIPVTGKVLIGTAPASATEIARVESPPLREIVGWINRWSMNYGAELLLKDVGARFGGAGSSWAGAKIVRQTLTSIHVPLDSFRMEDGSGLSLLDRVTPRLLAVLLQFMLRDRTRVGAAMRASLPVAGAPGTLLERMRYAPLRNNLRGKTGNVRGVRGMAGWVRAADGKMIVYVALFNHASSPLALTDPLDRFGLRLARLRE